MSIVEVIEFDNGSTILQNMVLSTIQYSRFTFFKPYAHSIAEYSSSIARQL